LFQLVLIERRICFSNRTPINASTINKLLNIKWPFHDSNEMIPPQLQGNSLLKVMMVIMYSVNAIINNREAYNPFNRQRGIINNMETRNSVRGNAQAVKGAMGFKIGDSAICSLKTAYSINLLMPVYKNRIINSTEMTSTIVAFESQAKDNTLRF
jgi:hypothetical protein